MHSEVIRGCLMIHTMIGLAAALSLVPGPAVADSSLTLTYQAKAVKLTCDPSGGGHPKADQACATLRGSGGNPARLEAGDSLCMMLYQPVTARVKGTWQGKRVKWERTYGNSCEMTRATGVLFQF
ncbi:hypothetical protein GCM10025331_60070 [Actinoplanes utahensis]|nr:hypothetical protein Aut01nite_43950 [Actinoplanes utahensis]